MTLMACAGQKTAGLRKRQARGGPLKQGKSISICLQTKLWLSLSLVAVIIGLGSWLLLGQINHVIGIVQSLAEGGSYTVGGSISPEDAELLLSGIKIKIVAAMLLAWAGLAAVGVYLRCRILQRVEKTAAMAEQMASGRLAELLPVHSRDEVGKLASAVNDLAMNLQEILLCMWNLSSQVNTALAGTAAALDTACSHEPLHQAKAFISEAKLCMEDMQRTIKAFGLYGVTIDGKGVYESESHGANA